MFRRCRDSGELHIRRECGVQAFCRRQNLGSAEFTSAEADQIGAPVRQGRMGNHAENPYNNRCDQMAVAESQKYK